MDIKECCKQLDNLVEERTADPAVVVRVCQVCTCRHYEITLDPVMFGLTGSSI